MIRRIGRTPALGVALVVAATLAGAGPAGLAGAQPPERLPSSTGSGTSVTLITGDQVLLPAHGGHVTVRPGFARGDVRFLTYRRGGDLYVVPDDAAQLVAAGRLDRALFDVTALVAQRYDDGSRDDVPLIVQVNGPRQVGGSKIPEGTTPNVDLPSIGAVAVTEGKPTAPHFWSQLRANLAGPGGITAPLIRVWLDARVHATLDRSVPQIGAPQAWARGLTGRGVTVAVLDTGVDQAHPDLADAVSQAQDFTGGESGTRDLSGHGTHVASIIAGSGAALRDGRYRGVAPDAALAVGKVLDDSGSGLTSWVISGMEWASQRAKVINMSLAGTQPSDGTQPMDLALDRLARQTGALFVVAAGNGGPGGGTVDSPGAADSALTVGAVDGRDRLAAFSGRGPRAGDNALKPDITAPGVDIVAARATGSDLGEVTGDGLYQRLSGTSAAAAHVAGAAAILAGEHPDWTGPQLKAALMGSARAVGRRPGVYEQGAGRVDVARAVDQGVYADPPSVGEGTQRWPHADDQPVSTPITYTNDTDAPVTLDLSLDVRGPGGRPAPRGMFDADSPRVTVPAHSAARVTLTADTRVAAPDGVYGGVLVASDGGRTSVRTPVGVTREAESYDLTLTATDRTGAPAADYGVELAAVDRQLVVDPYDATGTVTARLPKGRYVLTGFVRTPIAGSGPPGELDLTEFAEPNVVVDRDLSLALDARRGQGLAFAVDRPEARAGLVELLASGATGAGEVGLGAISFGTAGLYLAPSQTAAPAGTSAPSSTSVAARTAEPAGTAAPSGTAEPAGTAAPSGTAALSGTAAPARTAARGGFGLAVRGWLARPDGKGGFDGSPYLYHVAWTADGRVPGHLDRRFRDRDLVPVTGRYAAVTPGTGGLVDTVVGVRLPASLQEYFSPGVPWFNTFWELAEPGSPDVVAVQQGSGTVYAPGRPAVERWNAAPLGPAFPDDPFGAIGPSGFRLGDGIFVSLPLLTDAGVNRLSELFAATSGRTALTRDGVEVGRTDGAGFGHFEVPAADGAYRLDAEVVRDAELSTQVIASWQFRSAGAGEIRALPLMAVRFAPELDATNRAAAGRLLLPVSVQRQPGAAYGRLTSLTVQVSYDDGSSWQPVRLLGSGDRRTALVVAPPGARYASLRAVAVDSADNRVDQTIIRAYGLR